MRIRLMILGCLVAASCAVPPGGYPPAGLVDRVAGAPQRCITVQPSESIRLSQSDRNTLIFGTGQTIWANRLASQCAFRWTDVLVTKPLGASYCRGDVIRSFDNVARTPGSTCVLGDFIPYTYSARATY